MTKKERKAVARIFADLIKADRIVDKGEMEYWASICNKYGIDKEVKIDARDMSFAAALSEIKNSKEKELKDLLKDCQSMTVSDGFCAHSEALLMIALYVMLDSDQDLSGEVYSIPRANFDIDIATALYVEKSYDEKTNADIIATYRSIFKEFQLAGFHFVYIPNIIKHYQETPAELFKGILSFLAPMLSDEGLDDQYNSLMKMNTGTFCNDLLCNKCGISDLRSTEPAILIKIGNSFVGEDRYANYLKVNIRGTILETVQKIIDRFTEMLSSDIFVVNTSEERGDQFHFHGFYKQLLDIFLIKKNIRSSVLINPYTAEICFSNIDAKLSNVNRREKALYILLLCYGAEGINFQRPRNNSELESYNKRMDEIQKRYQIIYESLGADKEDTPDLTIPDIRRPIFSKLNTALKKLQGLYNPQDYYIHKEGNGKYIVHLDPTLIEVKRINYINSKEYYKKEKLLESRLYQSWKNFGESE